MDTVTIESGDTLSDIAAEHDASVSEIMEANPNISDANHIEADTDINVPAETEASSAAAEQAAEVQSTTSAAESEITTQSNEDASTITTEAPSNIEVLQSSEPDPTNEAQTSVTISESPPAVDTQEDTASGAQYTIQEGDTASEIAQAHEITVDALQQANPSITDPNKIQANDTLVIPTSAEQQSTPLPVDNTQVAQSTTEAQSETASSPAVEAPPNTASQPPVEANSSPQAQQSNDETQPPAPVSAVSPPANPQENTSARQHTVEQGQNLTTIAQQYGISLDALKQANPAITDPDKIQPGQICNVPGAAEQQPTPATAESTQASPPPVTAESTQASPPPVEASPSPQAQQSNDETQPPAPVSAVSPPANPQENTSARQHTVEQGQNLTTIAQQYGISLDTLKQANPAITDPDKIQPGQICNVPGAAEQQPTPSTAESTQASQPPVEASPSPQAQQSNDGTQPPAPVSVVSPPVNPQENTAARQHTVEQGQNLTTIAQQYGISLDALKQANPSITDPNKIQVDEKVIIPTAEQSSAPEQPQRPGQTPTLEQTPAVEQSQLANSVNVTKLPTQAQSTNNTQSQAERASSSVDVAESLSADKFKAIMPQCKHPEYLTHINEAFEKGAMNTYNRQAAFLAQIAHESGGLNYMKEIASGKDYEGRKNLGNTQSGDGERFKGRGPIQLTGRTNYRKAGEALGLDLENNPELVENLKIGFNVAVWYWTTNKCNEQADKNTDTSSDDITRTVNGPGMKGREKRKENFDKIKRILEGK